MDKDDKLDLIGIIVTCLMIFVVVPVVMLFTFDGISGSSEIQQFCIDNGFADSDVHIFGEDYCIEEHNGKVTKTEVICIDNGWDCDYKLVEGFHE